MDRMKAWSLTWKLLAVSAWGGRRRFRERQADSWTTLSPKTSRGKMAHEGTHTGQCVRQGEIKTKTHDRYSLGEN